MDNQDSNFSHNQKTLVEEDDKILSFDNSNTQNTPSQTLPQYRPSSGSIGSNNSSAGRARRNGPMRRSLLFVSGSGMQFTSPTGQASSSGQPKSPYDSKTLSHSSDALLSNNHESIFRSVSRDRARSQGSEMLLNTQKSPESLTVRDSEETNHPLIITKNSSLGNENRVFTPTPLGALDAETKQHISPNNTNNNAARTHIRRSSSLNKRSLLLTPNLQSQKSNFLSTPEKVINETEHKKSAKSFVQKEQEIEKEKEGEEEDGNEYGFRDQDVIENHNTAPNSVKKVDLPAPIPVEDNSSEVLSKLASKEAAILETKAELDDLKRLVKLKEEQLKEEQKQLEALKQEMALKLLKTHQKIPEDNNNIINTSNKLQFNNVSDSVTSIFDITRKGAQSLVANVNNSFEQREDHSVPTSKFMNISFEEELQFPTANNDNDNESEDWDNVVYSLNSPLKQAEPETIKEEEKLVEDPLDLNFKPKDETLIQESVMPQLNANSSNTFNNNRKPQRSKSRMSIYFNKTVSLVSQFDQMLQSELEKKMGIDEVDETAEAEQNEDPEEIIYDLPPKPDEIDMISKKSTVKRQHSRSLSSYRFFG
ncbi:hypothetical protein HANVADRAFT_52017 [Hanseniaspora valbyensis NRRL Y-1626]|uniref:Topoisomerase I damage affected protein 11 n=1 Tax=Hanseniaspora valbyensis NRRL Y-1626 TaxID=766949 RepID=A0A1B7TGQ7_9ASCO|nr:hypothetical protein HANVADRAFT_52017 [Hanseniaspora valbyensis NRRL Y-1626]